MVANLKTQSGQHPPEPDLIMEPVFKRVVFKDEWVRFAPRCWPLSWILPSGCDDSYEFIGYTLGYRLEATEREMNLIRLHEMFGETAIRIRETDPPITFADILGVEFVPEVHFSPNELFRIEARVRQAAISWTHFFEAMADA